MELKKKVRDSWRKTLFINDRKRLKNTDFTIISNNCWGGNVSRDLDVSYNSPFVGLFIYSEGYLKLCTDLEYYMKQDLEFITAFKMDDSSKLREFPVAMLGDVEINFNHYKSQEEVAAKWNRRKERINWDNLFFKFEENYGSTSEILVEFDQLPHENKIIFTENAHPELNNEVKFTNFDLDSRMRHYRRYFDVVEWLNSGKIVRR